MAGTEVGSLYYDLNIDDKKLKGQLDGADRSVRNLGNSISQSWDKSVNASKMALAAVAAVGAGAVAFGVTSVKAYNDSAAAIAQLNAVLSSTKGVAGVTKESAIALSREIQRTTNVSDEAALAVENMALTFTGIGKDIFPQATKTAIDMATALNGGVTPSAQELRQKMILLGKALQDPDAGLGALKRVGVNTEELAKKFVGLTSVTEKQKLILEELGTEFGGSAAAHAKTFAGRVQQLKNSFNDLQEGIGEVIVKALGPVADWFAKVVGRIQEAGGLLEVAKKFWKENKDVILAVGGAIAGVLTPALIAMGIAFGGFLLTIAPWALAGAALVLLFQHFDISIKDVVNALKAAYNYVSGFVIPIFNFLKAVWDALFPSLAAAASAVWQNLLPALKQLWDAVVRLWNALNPALMDALKIVAIVMGALLFAAIWIIINALNISIQVFSFFISVISNVIKWISNLISWFGTAAVAVVRFFKGLPGHIWDAMKGAGGWLYNVGKDLIQGLINGVRNMVGNLAGALQGAVDGAISGVKRKLGIKSPSTVFAKIGKNVTEGFVKGINDSAGLAMAAMGNLGNNIIAPSLNMASGNNAAGSVVNNAGTTVNIGAINNKQDEAWVIDRLDRNQQLESMGLSPL